MNRKELPDFILKHPFAFTAAACLLLLPLGFCQAENIRPWGVAAEAAVWCGGAAALAFFGTPGAKRREKLILLFSAAVLAALFSWMTVKSGNYSKVMFVPVLAWLVHYGVVLRRRGALTAQRAVFLMMVLGIAVRCCYCLTIGPDAMQHDAGAFDGSEEGHLMYISYWYTNGLRLPAFDVTTVDQFYHPPLHHLLMAGALKVFTLLGLPLAQALDAIQILPMIWSSLCMAAVYGICRQVRLEGAGLLTAMAVVCFYPTFIIWSGAYNNDILASFLMLLSLMLTLRWAQKPTLARILPIAVSVGCAMMAKLSGWMVAPAIALVFLWIFIRNIRKPLPMIGQFAAFGAVCAPLGLWWGVRNLVRFGIPISFVHDPGLKHMLVNNVPAVQRLFNISPQQFRYPYAAFVAHGAPYNEYNPLFGLLKTSLYDEYNQPWDFSEMATVFVIAAGVLALAGVVSLFRLLFSKKTRLDLMTRLFFVTAFLTILVSYYAFCFAFPYVCTENIRYCIPAIPILAIAAGCVRELRDP